MSLLDDITEEVIRYIRDGLMTDEEVVEAINRRLDHHERRIVAERDGWRAIARELLDVAFDGQLGTGELPPLEVVDLRTTGNLPSKSVAQIKQFWADLTNKHARDRHTRAQARGHTMVASEPIAAGDIVVVDSTGSVRRVEDSDR